VKELTRQIFEMEKAASEVFARGELGTLDGMQGYGCDNNQLSQSVR
jgi:hypothetical protein